MSLIEVKNICKSFGQLKAVNDVSFSIDEGTVFGFLGPNGAGKTTAIRMIMNIIIPDSGEISVMGESDMDKINNRIGYLPEERGIYRKMKVEDVLLFLAELKMMKVKEAKKVIEEWLEKFNLIEWKSKKVEELSKGMQQKLQFIGTVMFDPSLIILDEPFLGLDPLNVNLIKNSILEMKKQGKTIIFSTHSMESAEKLCDEIFLINKGEKVIAGKLSEVKENFGRRNIHISYDGKPDFLEKSDVIVNYDDFGKYTEIQLKEGADSQLFLKEIMEQVVVHKFEIVEPSLNDIFINSVSEK